MDKKTETVIFVRCEDSRMTPIEEKFIRDNPDKEVIPLCVAGADVRPVMESIDEKIREANAAGTPISIVVRPHNDCGAMGVVYAALREGRHFSELITDDLVGNFIGQEFSSRAELEQRNPDIQKAYLLSMVSKLGFKNVKIDCELADVSSIPRAKEEEKTLIIAEAGSASSSKLCEMAGVDPTSAYITTDCICKNGIRRILPSIELGVKELHITKVLIVTPDPRMERTMDVYEASLKHEQFMSANKATVKVVCARVSTPTPTPSSKPAKLKV